DIVAVAAGDVVDLAVASVEAIVAGAAVEGVALGVDLAVGAGVHVAARQGPQVVIARPAEARVLAEVGEDAVVAVGAVLGVVAGAADEHVVAGEAEDAIVAGVAVDVIGEARALQALVAGPAVDRGGERHARNEREGGDGAHGGLGQLHVRVLPSRWSAEGSA